jgi:predicted GNAT family acetyltransferase
MNQEYRIAQGDNRFYIGDEQNLIGEITFFENGNGQLVVDHTFVNPQYRGKNIGMILINAIVEYARNTNKLIIPVCPYVEKMFSRDSKFEDIWFK